MVLSVFTSVSQKKKGGKGGKKEEIDRPPDINNRGLKGGCKDLAKGGSVFLTQFF